MTTPCRSVSWLMAAAISLVSLGCSKDAEVLGFAGDFDKFSSEIVKRVKTAPNPLAGVEAAQKYLDENKAPMREKLEAIKSVRGFQISEDTKKKVEASLMNGASAVAGLQLDFVGQTVTDAAFGKKIEKLVTDYKNVIAQ